ncbi:alpha/beta fold hydrolase [Cytobacillus gottheilii]|uniref:alpha/beta fold hydrolase n=1 Tax=Cytobacillus gottheilii TaxID=859144 RepID=UPI00082C97BE|nr:alpha/beta hydrolase [Cytobacillus gottheilii]
MGHYINTENNVQIYAEDIGEGQPVIFLHGWPLNHGMFEYQMNELPKHEFRFIGIDLRGYGKSDRPFNGYDYDTMADDLHEVIQKLDLKDAVLAGFSMGGPIALRYMSRYDGDRISKLLLLSPAAPIFTKRDDYPFGMEKEEVDTLIDQLKKDRPHAIASFGEKFFEKEPSEEFQQWFLNMAISSSSYGTIHSAIALRDEDLRNELSGIAAPITILHGKKDQICPYDFSVQLADQLPNAKLVPFEESGHGVFHDEPEKYKKQILEFLQSSSLE